MLYSVSRNIRDVKRGDVMKRNAPGPSARTILETRRQAQADRLNFLLNLSQKYGDIVHLRIRPFTHSYLLNNPDYIRYVLVDAPQKFEKGPAFKRATSKAIGTGLLTSEGDFHRRQRKLVQPAFHQQRIASYGRVMIEHTERMLDRWRPDLTLDIHREMMKLTLGIVSKTLFDADVSDEADEIGEAITVGLKAAEERTRALVTVPDWIPTAKNRQRHKADRLMSGIIMRFISDRRALGEDKGDLLSMLLMAVDEDDGGQMTNKQVRDEVTTLFIAGHETTANALTWTWYLLAQHPEVEAKLLAELNTVLSGCTPTVDDLARLPYTDMVIKEAMRLYPPAWVLARQAQEPITLGGYEIGRGSILLMSQYITQRDPRYFADPESFKPERFAPELEKLLPRYAYFPFGGGPRICIGQSFAMMEARLLLAAMAQRYRLSLATEHPVALAPMVTLRPRHGITMRLALRETEEPAAMPI
jgi:cytochrome P450